MTKMVTKAKSLVIERPNGTVENVSLHPDVLESKMKTKPELMAEAQPTKLTKINSDYPVKEDDNLRHIGKTVSTPEETINRQNI